MKRLSVLCLASILVLGLCSCGPQQTVISESPKPIPSNSPQQTRELEKPVASNIPQENNEVTSDSTIETQTNDNVANLFEIESVAGVKFAIPEEEKVFMDSLNIDSGYTSDYVLFNSWEYFALTDYTNFFIDVQPYNNKHIYEVVQSEDFSPEMLINNLGIISVGDDYDLEFFADNIKLTINSRMETYLGIPVNLEGTSTFLIAPSGDFVVLTYCSLTNKDHSDIIESLDFAEKDHDFRQYLLPGDGNVYEVVLPENELLDDNDNVIGQIFFDDDTLFDLNLNKDNNSQTFESQGFFDGVLCEVDGKKNIACDIEMNDESGVGTIILSERS